MKILKPIIILLVLFVTAVVIFVYSSEKFSFFGFGRRVKKPQAAAKPQEFQPKEERVLPQALPKLPVKPAVEPQYYNPQPSILAAIKQKPAPLPMLREIAVLSGFACAKLKDKQNYEFVPIIVRFGFDLARLADRYREDKRQLFIFELEPFASFVASPDKNAEAGVNLLLKYGCFVTKKLCPYIELGSGFVYITQHTREQSTQFNFIPQAGAGVSYFVRNNISVNAGYRYRHLSNSAIRRPNKGIDADMLLFGVSFYF